MLMNDQTIQVHAELLECTCNSEELGCGECDICTKQFGIFRQLEKPRKFKKNPLDSTRNLTLFIELIDDESNEHNPIIVPALEKIYSLEGEDLKEALQTRLEAFEILEAREDYTNNF